MGCSCWLDLDLMPLHRKLPTEHTVCSCNIFFHTYDADETNIQSLEFTEGYHFHPSHSNKKIMKLTAWVPDNESLSNPRYIAVEKRFTHTRTSLVVHDCCVMVRKDMYVVMGVRVQDCWAQNTNPQGWFTDKGLQKPQLRDWRESSRNSLSNCLGFTKGEAEHVPFGARWVGYINNDHR